MRRRRLVGDEGVALVAALMMLLLMSALMMGFAALVAGDQKLRGVDRDRYKAFYGAHSGLEKLNADLATLFFANVAPTAAQIDALKDNPPSIPDATFITEGDAAYGVTVDPNSSCPPPCQISTGPYQGLYAMKKTYKLSSAVRTVGGGEAHLNRFVETVAIPVFQFGMFSDMDLSFSAADDFDFGGRIHTNGSLFLAQGGGSSGLLTLRDKVTAVGEIVRQRLSNGVSIDVSGSTRPVKVATAPNAFRNLLRTEGSVQDGVNSAPNSSWPTISLSTYNGYIRTGKTGARALNLPVLTAGGANISLVQRPVANEDATNATLFGERFFSKVSLRILLSDTANDITSLPTVTATAPVELDGNWITTPPNNGTAYGPVDDAHPPVARSPGPLAVATTVTGGNIAGGTNRNIPVTPAVPAGYRLPATLTVSAGGVDYVVACTGKTAVSFTGCGASNPVHPAINAGAVVRAVVVTPDGNVDVSTTTNATWPLAGTTIGVVSTLDFAANTFWVAGTNNLVTCEGYDPTPRFIGCNVRTGITNGAAISTGALSGAGTGTVGGFIKIELQDTAGTWRDVTMEILNWGFAGSNLNAAGATVGKACGDPTPNAIIRLQRLRDNTETTATLPVLTCSYASSRRSTDYWPNALLDPREGVFRDTAAANNSVMLGGVIYYVALDVGNLSRWFAGSAPYGAGSGPTAMSNGGYSVYFSDRRNNRDAAGAETGEYGFEDVVNPLSATGAPNGVLDAGEDLNGSGTLETYGQNPNYTGLVNVLPPGAAAAPAPFNAAATIRPWTPIGESYAKTNRAYLFRRALKLTNGGLGNIVAPGLAVISENPVYVQGDWNANQAGFGNTNVATSITADAVTLLSNAWNDNNSFASPYATGGRIRSADSYYRLAIIAGKGPIFLQPNGTGATFGTDGGAHSFLRFIEGGTASTIHYRGSLVSFFYNRQAVAPFKCCGGVVYDVPQRDYAFDVDFLDPSRLPPLTPVFRDLNSLGFSQETRPGR